MQAALARVVQADAMPMAVSFVASRARRGLALPAGHLFRSHGAVQVLAFDVAGVDAKTAAGETLIYFRAVMAQGEVSQTSERTLHAMRALKAKGIAQVARPTAREYLDRPMPKVAGSSRTPAKIATIARVRELHAEGKESRPSPTSWSPKAGRPRRSPRSTTSVRDPHSRSDRTAQEVDRSDAVRDQDRVMKRIAELRALNFSQGHRQAADAGNG